MPTRSASPQISNASLAHSASLGSYASAVGKRIARISQQNFAQRFWAKDPTLWKRDKKSIASISNRLGWLRAPEAMHEHLPSITSLADEVRRDGFTHALLLGMGGSSLGAEVLRQTCGVAAGFLDLAVLDSTDPAQIRRLERRAPLEKTLFLVSTKSGTTTETLCFYRYFFEKLRSHRSPRAGENFIAITDPGTPLVAMAQEQSFRRTFINPADIGGRFSVLSLFGLVPAALLGIPVDDFLARAARFLPAPGHEAETNPAIELGATLGELALRNRNKVTFFLSPALQSFGTWVEQLIAESTGKEGRGLLPVVGEPPAAPATYGSDRVFVHLQLRGSRDQQIVRALQALEAAGHPVIHIPLADRLDLASEFFRWEISTAVAAAVLQVNPFDEPNVKESKDNTSRLLGEVVSRGSLPQTAPLLREASISLFADAHAKSLLHLVSKKSPQRKPRLREILAAHFRQATAGSYIALLAYITPTLVRERSLRRLQAALRDTFHVAVTAGFGPRYLHSTGQFHKGGTPNGVFLEITSADSTALPIPGERYSFSTLKHAQALGDFEALASRRRPILRLHCEKNIDRALDQIFHWLTSARA